MGIMQATNSTLCLDNIKRKARLVALVQLHVNLLVLKDHLVLQIPSSTPAELCDDCIAVAEEVDVEVGVRTRL